jgi:hypothetical protein
MNKPVILAGLLTLGCALPQSAGEPSTIPISVRSHNKSSVDVYLLCGDRNAEWLGVAHGKETAFFEVSSSRARCVHGLNFFLLPRNSNRGYWVGPFQMSRGSSVGLTIEKYAGLSAAQVGYK